MLEAIDLIWFAVYVALGLASIAAVRKAGPDAMDTRYVIEEEYDRETGPKNVAYRILAPMLCCGIPVFLMTMVADFVSIPLPQWRVLPLVIYWFTLGVIKHARNRLIKYLIPFLSEAATSVAIAYAFDWFVIEGYLRSENGLEVFDNSSIAFQMEVALFWVIVSSISAAFVRISNRGTRTSPTGEARSKDESKYSCVIDTSEAKLFFFERKFGKLLPQRFQSDILLRCVFFSIMAIEDGNRPRLYRFVENVAARLGLAKTTGIMQQRGGKPLTDEESVIRAIPYVEDMWDRFLLEFARSSEGSQVHLKLQISAAYYEYDYQALSISLIRHFGKLYGDYCGTRCLNADQVIRDVLAFEENERYGFKPQRVCAPGSLCTVELDWLSGNEMYWRDSSTVVSCLSRAERDAVTLRKDGNVSKHEVSRITELLKASKCRVYEVKYVEPAFARIICSGDHDVIAGIAAGDWTIGEA